MCYEKPPSKLQALTVSLMVVVACLLLVALALRPMPLVLRDGRTGECLQVEDAPGYGCDRLPGHHEVVWVRGKR
jgi:hypothetical protein